MKKTIVGSLAVAALMSSSSAMAEVTNNSLTTKGYVDAGLNAVYSVAKGASDAIGNASSGLTKDVNDLKSQVSATTTGLLDRVTALEQGAAGDVTQLQSDVTQLQSDVSDLQDQIDGIDVPEYVAGTGITITDGTGADVGKKVIAADVATTWDASVLVNP